MMVKEALMSKSRELVFYQQRGDGAAFGWVSRGKKKGM